MSAHESIQDSEGFEAVQLASKIHGSPERCCHAYPLHVHHVLTAEISDTTNTPASTNPVVASQHHGFDRRKNFELSILEGVHPVQPAGGAIAHYGEGAHDKHDRLNTSLLRVGDRRQTEDAVQHGHDLAALDQDN